MPVIVQAVLKDGRSTKAVSHQCFGFAYDRDSTKGRLGAYPEQIHKIIFLPQLPIDRRSPGFARMEKLTKELEIVFKHYLTALFNVFGDSIQLVHPKKGVLSVFTDGVQADVTVLPGPEWVGLFELVRNCQDNPEFVKWVSIFLQAGAPFSYASYLPRAFKTGKVLPDGTVDAANPIMGPSADTTPSDVLSPELLKYSYLKRNRMMYKPWTEGQDFFGVYHYFHGYTEDWKGSYDLRPLSNYRTIPEVLAFVSNTFGVELATSIRPKFLDNTGETNVK